MGVSTVTAARIYHAQLRNLTGKDVNLAFENFPYVALSKTYNTDAQVPDSAATATAYICGVKAKLGTLGVNQHVYRKNCTNNMDNAVTSYLHHAIDAGKWAGIVTTTRITHATPAASYAHIGERDWESDTDVMKDIESAADREKCPDAAHQLIHAEKNRNLRVILGGGRSKFMLENQTDPEYGYQSNGTRKDEDLIQAWTDYKSKQFPNDPEKYKYITKQSEFDNANENELEYLFGLFEPSHMLYESERSNEPSLAEMTTKAIKMLQRSENGFALLVEGGRIDHGHHDSYTAQVLRETVAFSDAVRVGAELTDESDTLIVVTADHSHAFAFNGYPYISNDILGLVREENQDHTELELDTMSDGKPFTTLMYLNGPGFAFHRHDINDTEIPRRDLTDDKDLGKASYEYDAGMWTSSETHGGEEVAIYARGPMSHLFHGTHEQNYIAHVMMYASCIGPNKDHCEKDREFPQCANYAVKSSLSYPLLLALVLKSYFLHSYH